MRFDQKFFIDVLKAFNEPTWTLAGIHSGSIDDMELTDAGYGISLALPGVGKDNIEVTIDQSVIRVSTKGDIKGYANIRVPDDLDQEKIETTYTDGVLTIRAPQLMHPKAKRTTIKIQG